MAYLEGAGERFDTNRGAEMGPALQREQHFEPKPQRKLIDKEKKHYAKRSRTSSRRHQGREES
eukprot:678802-Pyramimonas_sp.AAC.1